ncbi:NUDIX domain-containing protein [Microbacterium immunditiarum]|uniref:8-oxo-dGTP pyrophosphatase MutT (NUDIX family) n=1 Tax=Microbacterium immunditiarum TaxID=337480 RepID=A0A7Y9KLK4_9MICO|nr:8-oxo-dGTP pyrophosphatase MutT (NUDIX family) [Microbacterium immunditiarum]
MTAVVQVDDRFLVARQRDSGLWSLVGGSIEPGEEPEAALLREVREELGVPVAVRGIVGAYGGAALETSYPNGDRVGYVTIAYRCEPASTDFALEPSELIETRWVTQADIAGLDRHRWIDDVLEDAVRTAP